MATVLEVMEHAARECSISKIVGLSTSQTETAMMLRDKLNEAAEELLDRIDLPSPITVDYNVVGTGAESYALPAAFRRLTRDDGAVYEKTSYRRVCTPVTSNGAWTHIKQFGSSGATRYYRLSGDDGAGYQISFFKPLAVGETVTVSYVSKNWVRDVSSTLKSSWTAETDVLLFPVSLIRLGVVWRVKAKKGMTYSDIQAEYEIRLSRAINDGRGVRTVDIGDVSVLDGPTKIEAPDVVNFA